MASGSAGQFFFAYIVYFLLSEYILSAAFYYLGAITLMILVLAPALRHNKREDNAEPQQPVTGREIGQSIKTAFGHSSFILLFWGFFVCGFHVAFITIHLPPYLSDLGMSSAIAATAISMIGLFNIIGSFGIGLSVSARGQAPSASLDIRAAWRRDRFVSAIAHHRIFRNLILVGYGPAMAIDHPSDHPIGRCDVSEPGRRRHYSVSYSSATSSVLFIGVWLGGVLFEATGNYHAMWWLAVALGVHQRPPSTFPFASAHMPAPSPAHRRSRKWRLLTVLLLAAPLAYCQFVTSRHLTFSQYPGMDEAVAIMEKPARLPGPERQRILRRYRPRIWLAAGQPGPIDFYRDYIAHGRLYDGNGTLVDTKNLHDFTL